MSFNIYNVNANGMEQIRHFLLANHKHPEEATTERALLTWAADAECYADVNDGAVVVEISAEDCIHGHAVAITLDESCLEIETIREF